LPERRTAMTPVALAAAITRTGGRRLEVPYLPPSAPPPRFPRMGGRRGRAWAREGGRARGRRRVGATPGVTGASCVCPNARRAANGASRVWRALDERVERQTWTRNRRGRALFRVSAGRRAWGTKSKSARAKASFRSSCSEGATTSEAERSARLSRSRVTETAGAGACDCGETWGDGGRGERLCISARPPRQNSRLAGGSRRTSRWRTPSRP
jgi:hypothetical protein